MARLLQPDRKATVNEIRRRRIASLNTQMLNGKEFTVLKWPPDLDPIEHLWDVAEWGIHIMDVQLTNLQIL